MATEYLRHCNQGRGPPAQGRAPPAVLDFGAGIGNSVPFVRKYLPDAQITCLDVSTKSLEIGQSRFPIRPRSCRSTERGFRYRMRASTLRSRRVSFTISVMTNMWRCSSNSAACSLPPG
jgi:hypothetical protein